MSNSNSNNQNNSQGQSQDERGKAPVFADDKGKPEVNASLIAVPTAEERRK